MDNRQAGAAAPGEESLAEFLGEMPPSRWRRFRKPILIGVGAVVVLVVAAARARTETWAVGIGLILGGAIGNGIDRLAYGAVVDFALLHAEIGGKTYNWYVFNIADVAIVVGVAALLYDSLIGLPAAKAP